MKEEEEEARFMETKLHLTQKEIRDLIVEALKARDFRTTGGVHVAFVTEQDGKIAALVKNMRECTEEEKEQQLSQGTTATPKEEDSEEGRQVMAVPFSRILEVTEQVLVREGLEGSLEQVTSTALDILFDHEDLPRRESQFRKLLDALEPLVRNALEQLRDDGKAVFVEGDEDEDAYWRANRKPKKKAPPKKKAKEGSGNVAITNRDTIDAISGETILGGVTCVWFNDLGVTRTHPEDWPDDLRKEYDPSPDMFDFLKDEKPEPSANAAADILGGDGGVMDRSDALGSAVGDERPAARVRKSARRRR